MQNNERQRQQALFVRRLMCCAVIITASPRKGVRAPGAASLSLCRRRWARQAPAAAGAPPRPLPQTQAAPAAVAPPLEILRRRHRSKGRLHGGRGGRMCCVKGGRGGRSEAGAALAWCVEGVRGGTSEACSAPEAAVLACHGSPPLARTCSAAHAAAPAQVPAGGSRHQQALGVGLQGLKGDCLLGGYGVVLCLHSRHSRHSAAQQACTSS